MYPREIEEILYTHPDVVEAAVVAIPHLDLGEEVAAAVVLRQGACATPEELSQFVKERVAPYKYPRRIQLVKELPRSHTGKILRKNPQGRRDEKKLQSAKHYQKDIKQYRSWLLDLFQGKSG